MRFVTGSFFVLLLAGTAHGGAINRYSSMSTEYTANPNRYATTEPDGAFYNPAGLAFGPEGLSFSLDNQVTMGVDGFTQEERSVSTTQWAPLCPALSVAYRRGDWALYFGSGLIGGGATELEGKHPALDESKPYLIGQVNDLQFDGGNVVQDARFDHTTLQAMSLFAGAFAGGAYRVNDAVSISLGGKLAYTWGGLNLASEFELYSPDLLWFYEDSMELVVDQRGVGGSLTAGVHWKVSDAFQLALRGETSTRIRQHSVTVVDTAALLEDESVSRSDIPGTVSLGWVYELRGDVRLLGSAALFFNEQANYGELLGFDITGKLEMAWEIGGGLEYRVLKDLVLKAGYLRFVTGFRGPTRTSMRFGLDAHYVNGGATYRFGENWSATGGVMAMIFDSATERTGKTTLEPFALVMGSGLTYRF
jgi:opacity protein-like surface antigen